MMKVHERFRRLRENFPDNVMSGVTGLVFMGVAVMGIYGVATNKDNILGDIKVAMRDQRVVDAQKQIQYRFDKYPEAQVSARNVTFTQRILFYIESYTNICQNNNALYLWYL